jgi:hypothetical protein
MDGVNGSILVMCFFDSGSRPQPNVSIKLHVKIKNIAFQDRFGIAIGNNVKQCCPAKACNVLRKIPER